MSCLAHGSPPPTLAWYRDGVLIDATADVQDRIAMKIFEDCGGGLCKEFIIGWNQYQSSTTLGLEPVSSSPPKTNLNNAM